MDPAETESTLSGVRIKIFADGAEIGQIRAMLEKPYIRGFTTNPTLMRRAGVTDYERFARDVLTVVQDLPVSFEVFSDDFDDMVRQARRIATWGPNVYVKIPVTNTSRLSSATVVRTLSRDGIKVNVTAVLTLAQVEEMARALDASTPAVLSLFAGRIADTGTDPVPMVTDALGLLRDRPSVELLWASPREVLNIVQADRAGCHIITVTPDILGKLHLLGTPLDQLSLDTVRMFHRDATAAGYSL